MFLLQQPTFEWTMPVVYFQTVSIKLPILMRRSATVHKIGLLWTVYYCYNRIRCSYGTPVASKRHNRPYGPGAKCHWTCVVSIGQKEGEKTFFFCEFIHSRSSINFYLPSKYPMSRLLFLIYSHIISGLLKRVLSLPGSNLVLLLVASFDFSLDVPSVVIFRFRCSLKYRYFRWTVFLSFRFSYVSAHFVYFIRSFIFRNIFFFLESRIYFLLYSSTAKFPTHMDNLVLLRTTTTNRSLATDRNNTIRKEIILFF